MKTVFDSSFISFYFILPYCIFYEFILIPDERLSEWVLQQQGSLRYVNYSYKSKISFRI